MLLEDDRIPYPDMATRLFGAGKQEIVPFLGAGASLPPPAAPGAAPALPAGAPSRAQLDAVTQGLGITGSAAALVRVAALLAFKVMEWERTVEPPMVETIQNATHPPSVWQLTRLFSELARYSSLEVIVDRLAQYVPAAFADRKELAEGLHKLARATGVADPPDLLTSISSLYEATSHRKLVWQRLQQLIGNKVVSTEIHDLIADSAQHHLARAGAVDYLIVTTNYDCLMEQALTRKGLPYVVLMTRKDQRVIARFSPNADTTGQLALDHADQFPNNFVLQKPASLVVLHKLHGCASPQPPDSPDDGIVLSDDDYVKFISQMSRPEGVVPNAVRSLMRFQPFLFLGYSLSDWNVRSMLDLVWEQRGKKKGVSWGNDVSVMLGVREYDRVFLEKNHVTIYKTDLTRFAEQVRANMPA